MNQYEKNSTLSQELLPAIYKELKAKGYRLTGGFRVAKEDEDKFQKIDAFFNINGVKDVPFQVRAYGNNFYKEGFPVRDAKLKYSSEWDLLKEGKMDDVQFVFASTCPSSLPQYKWKFLKIKMCLGKYLRKYMKGTPIGERSFDDGNHVTYIPFPPETVTLRDWGN